MNPTHLMVYANRTVCGAYKDALIPGTTIISKVDCKECMRTRAYTHRMFMDRKVEEWNARVPA